MTNKDKILSNTETRSKTKFSGQLVLYYLNRLILLIVLAVTVIFFSLMSPYFLSFKNLLALGLNISVIGIVCIGQSLCILTRGFDLSVGFNAGLCGIVLAYLTKNMEVPYIISVLLAIILGTAIGLINGLIITKGRVNALITTLSTGFILSGFILVVSHGYSIIINRADFAFIGTTRVFGIPLPLIIMALLYLLFGIILKYTVFGRYAYCIGGNPTSARIAGINVEKVQLQIFAITGTLAALAGILLASRLGSAQNTAGSTYALDSIAAVVLGGTVLAGGEGSVVGTLLGVIIIGILQNGLIMIGVPQQYQNIATGLVLILAVLLQNFNVRTSPGITLEKTKILK